MATVTKGLVATGTAVTEVNRFSLFQFENLGGFARALVRAITEITGFAQTTGTESMGAHFKLDRMRMACRHGLIRSQHSGSDRRFSESRLSDVCHSFLTRSVREVCLHFAIAFPY